MGVLTATVMAAAVGVALMALSSCATLNQSQCEVTDWRQLGVTNGAQGQPRTYIDRHRDACARYGIVVDATAWQSGWQQGIRKYCTPLNGLSVGRERGFHRNGCPADLAPGFDRAFQVGRAVHDARQRRDDIQNEIDRLIGELRYVATPEGRNAIQWRIDVRRDALFDADLQVRLAERRADRFQLHLAGP